MERGTEQTYVLAAIASLRNEVISRDDNRKASIEAIVDHLAKLNGKTAKNSLKITRLNLVVFTFGGAVGVAGLAAIFQWVLK